jgi:hypothetical protein
MERESNNIQKGDIIKLVLMGIVLILLFVTYFEVMNSTKKCNECIKIWINITNDRTNNNQLGIDQICKIYENLP